MAGKEISEIFCWEIEVDGLKIHMGSSHKGVVRIGIDMDTRHGCVDYFSRTFPETRITQDEYVNRALVNLLKSLLYGKQPITSPKTDISSTHFQKIVWEKIAEIPFGETRTYGDVARIIGKPLGARAVGQAMNKNPLPIIYP